MSDAKRGNEMKTAATIKRILSEAGIESRVSFGKSAFAKTQAPVIQVAGRLVEKAEAVLAAALPGIEFDVRQDVDE